MVAKVILIKISWIFYDAVRIIAEDGIGFCVAEIKNENYKNINFTHYTVNDGLVHNVVQAFVEDDDRPSFNFVHPSVYAFPNISLAKK